MNQLSRIRRHPGYRIVVGDHDPDRTPPHAGAKAAMT